MIGAAELPLRCHFLQPVCEKMVSAEPRREIRVKPLPCATHAHSGRQLLLVN